MLTHSIHFSNNHLHAYIYYQMCLKSGESYLQFLSSMRAMLYILKVCKDFYLPGHECHMQPCEKGMSDVEEKQTYIFWDLEYTRDEIFKRI